MKKHYRSKSFPSVKVELTMLQAKALLCKPVYRNRVANRAATKAMDKLQRAVDKALAVEEWIT